MEWKPKALVFVGAPITSKSFQKASIFAMWTSLMVLLG
jgi:hypothetical protein